MDEAIIRRKCEEKLRELEAVGLPSPLTIEGLAVAVERLTGKPVLLESRLGVACALWVPRDHANTVVYDPDRGRYEQALDICHELSHGIFGHIPTEIMEDRSRKHESLQELLNSGSTKLGDMLVLKRSMYATREDREAETLGRMLFQRYLQGEQLGLSTNRKTAEVLARLPPNRAGRRRR